MKYKGKARRIFIYQCLQIGSVVLLGGCGLKKSEKETKETTVSTDPCNNLSGISEQEIQKRKKFGYTQESPILENQCHNCKLYIPPGPDKACGECMLFKGPVQSTGYCTYWAPNE